VTRSSPAEHDCVAVVVAYRSAHTLEDCLSPLIADAAVGHVVVVDNSSEEASAALIARLATSAGGTRLEYVDAGSNMGFAAACNLGLARSVAAVVVLVNPDVRLNRGVGPLADLLERSPRAVVAGGLMDRNGAIGNARADASLSMEFRRALFGTPAVTTVPADDRVHSVPQVDGALLLVRRDLLVELGGLANEFPLYYEDVELCWRVRRAGGSVRLHAAVYGVHRGGASSAMNPRAYVALRVSRQRWLRLRYGRIGAGAGVLLSALELLTRALGGTTEGFGARSSALRSCLAEAHRPLSQRPLAVPQPE
jgi:N-acetylglucosaminyl-diphospho-decaprenol L-rhamnosyltransferase